MSFAFPPADEMCFVDANILYYSTVASAECSSYCIALSKEILTGVRRAATVSSAVADAVHKVMCSEVVKVHKRSRAGLIGWIKQHPDALTSLHEFMEAAEEYSKLPLQWLPITPGMLVKAGPLAAMHGLMVNDALNVAAMQEYGIRHLVTNDDDFRGVPGIKVWKPR